MNVQAAQQEWEALTVPVEGRAQRSRQRGTAEPFRRLGQAQAWVEWHEACELKKIESLSPGQGAATALLATLKGICGRHGVVIFGHAQIYQPEHPAGPLLSQDALLAWFEKHGFLIERHEWGVSFRWYAGLDESL
jgi:hypothetical protein